MASKRTSSIEKQLRNKLQTLQSGWKRTKLTLNKQNRRLEQRINRLKLEKIKLLKKARNEKSLLAKQLKKEMRKTLNTYLQKIRTVKAFTNKITNHLAKPVQVSKAKKLKNKSRKTARKSAKKLVNRVAKKSARKSARKSATITKLAARKTSLKKAGLRKAA